MQMTKNEYQEFVKKCAERYWNEPGYTMEKMNADCDAIEILPLDLSAYPQIDEETGKWINALFKEEDTDRNGNYMLRGFTRHEMAEVDRLGLYYGDYANAYSFFAFNDDKYLIYEYTEGDTTLKIFPDKESYQREYNATLSWFREERGA